MENSTKCETETLKVDITKIKPTNIKVDSLKIGRFEIKAFDDELYIKRDGKTVFAITNENDVFINDKSFNKINEVLENHYNALKKLIEKN